MALTLSPEETRILGCLIEKERTTPDQYPLSLNSVTTACNQSTNRDPVTYYGDNVVALGLDDLRGKKLVTQLWGAGSRVQKFRHNLLDAYKLNPREVALLCVLLLRGPQMLGELRIRTERLHAFASVGEVEECLRGLSEGAEPLVRELPARPGQKENRFVQLLSGEPVLDGPAAAEIRPAVASGPTRVETLESEVATLKSEVAALREEFARFCKQLE
ncbi:MAG: DUF480 domain-containing protein [Pedosphaera sp.]|nr:DUF480 domain-containing protein [Pedosphaera sp.]